MLSVLAFAQDQTGGIHGAVLDAITHQPVHRATLTLQGSGQTPRRDSAGHSAITGVSGEFSFDALPPGEYALTVQQPNYPQTRQIRKKVEVKSGEISDGVAIELIPGGAISGHVLDQDGDPVGGCSVRAHPAAGPEQGAPGSISSPDENGEYRLFHLAPGKYTVWVNCFTLPFEPRPFSSGPDPPPSRAYLNQYYPGATDANSAQAIEVAPGAEKSGVDFEMHTAAVTEVRGSFSPDGADWHGQHINVQLVPVDPAAGLVHTAARVDPEKGTFRFERVFPGSYYVVALAASGPDSRIGAIQQINVGDKPGDIVISLSGGFDLNGTLQLEGNGTSLKIPLYQFSVQLIPARMMGLGGAFARVNEDGTFTLKSVLPIGYRMRVDGPGAFVKSAWLGSNDIAGKTFDASAEPLKITMSANTATITGTAPAGQVVFASGPDGGMVRGAAPDATGHFKIAGLAPGKYRVFCVDEGTSPNEAAGQGEEITVGEGETAEVDVKPAGSQQ